MYKLLFQGYDLLKQYSADTEKRVFIRGCGRNGRRLLLNFRSLGITVDGFCDVNQVLRGRKVLGIDVISPESVYNYPVGSYILVNSIADDTVYACIEEEALAHGLIIGKDFLDCGIKLRGKVSSTDGGSNIRTDEPIYLTDEKIISNIKSNNLIISKVVDDFFFDPTITQPSNMCNDLDFVITEYCSLKCEYCSHGIPLCKNPRHFDPDTIVDDLDKLLGSTRIAIIGIMGGEPLLHPRFAEILHKISKMKNIKNAGCFRIVTNATIPVSDEILRAFNEISVPHYFFISNYGKKSKAIAQIEDNCKKMGVAFETQVLSYVWKDMGSPEYSRDYSDSEMKNIFANCYTASNCNQLIDGEFWSCTRLPMLVHNGYVPADTKMFVNIRETDAADLEAKLHKFIYETEELSGCQYCDGFYHDTREVKKGE